MVHGFSRSKCTSLTVADKARVAQKARCLDFGFSLMGQADLWEKFCYLSFAFRLQTIHSRHGGPSLRDTRVLWYDLIWVFSSIWDLSFEGKPDPHSQILPE